MKGALVLLAGVLLGAVIVMARLGRYQFTLTTTTPGIAYGARLDRWTGRVDGGVMVSDRTTWQAWSYTPRWEDLGTPAPFDTNKPYTLIEP